MNDSRNAQTVRKSLTWLVALFVLASGFALQAQTFQRTLGGVYDDRPFCVEKASTGGYIICGDQSMTEFV